MLSFPNIFFFLALLPFLNPSDIQQQNNHETDSNKQSHTKSAHTNSLQPHQVSAMPCNRASEALVCADGSSSTSMQKMK